MICFIGSVFSPSKQSFTTSSSLVVCLISTSDYREWSGSDGSYFWHLSTFLLPKIFHSVGFWHLALSEQLIQQKQCNSLPNVAFINQFIFSGCLKLNLTVQFLYYSLVAQSWRSVTFGTTMFQLQTVLQVISLLSMDMSEQKTVLCRTHCIRDRICVCSCHNNTKRFWKPSHDI